MCVSIRRTRSRRANGHTRKCCRNRPSNAPAVTQKQRRIGRQQSRRANSGANVKTVLVSFRSRTSRVGGCPLPSLARPSLLHRLECLPAYARHLDGIDGRKSQKWVRGGASAGDFLKNALTRACPRRSFITCCPCDRAVYVQARTGIPSLLVYPLTEPRQFDILQSGPGWEGTECNSISSNAEAPSRC